jgi:hypothetical protein
MIDETDLMRWINSESDGEERKQREILRNTIFNMLGTARSASEGPGEIADILSHAIAEYVLQGVCGSTFKRERQ